MRNHFTGDACIATYNNFAAIFSVYHLLTQTSVGGYRLGNVNGIEGISSATTDGATESGDGFNESHSMNCAFRKQNAHIIEQDAKNVEANFYLEYTFYTE